MEHKLDLNFNTYPFCFSNDSVITSILANEKLVNEKLIELVDVIYNGQKFNYKDWLFSGAGIDKEITENGLIIKSDIYSSFASGSFFREREADKFECVIHVKNQILRSRWSYVGFFVAKDLKKADNNSIFKYDYNVIARLKAGHTDGFSILDEALEEDKKIIYQVNVKLPCEYWLKIGVADDTILTYYSFDGENWDEITKIANSDFTCLGFEYNFYKTDYYDWFFYHYTNITSSQSLMTDIDGTPLEYFQQIQKHSDHFIINPFLDFFKIPFDFFSAIDKEKCIEIIRSLIDSEYYVKVNLNEYYIPDRHAYKKYDFSHENLVFGYDAEKKTIWIEGYDTNQIVSPIEIDYEVFLDSFYSLRDNVHAIKVSYPYSPPELTKEMIYKNIYNFLNSVDLHKNYTMFSGGRTRNYGISFFETLLNNRDEIFYFLTDKRLIHFIYEHELVLDQLVVFLFKRNIISESSYQTLLKRFDELLNISNSIRMSVLKVAMKRRFTEKNVDETQRHLRELYELEKEALQNLLDILK